MPYDPMPMLVSAGYKTPPPFSGHSREVLRALECCPCKDCGKPVGRYSRSTLLCLSCLKAEFERIGLPLPEFDRMVYAIRAGYWN